MAGETSALPGEQTVRPRSQADGRDVRAPGAVCVTDWKVSYMLTQIEPLSEDSTAL